MYRVARSHSRLAWQLARFMDSIEVSGLNKDAPVDSDNFTPGGGAVDHQSRKGRRCAPLSLKRTLCGRSSDQRARPRAYRHSRRFQYLHGPHVVRCRVSADHGRRLLLRSIYEISMNVEEDMWLTSRW